MTSIHHASQPLLRQRIASDAYDPRESSSSPAPASATPLRRLDALVRQFGEQGAKSSAVKDAAGAVEKIGEQHKKALEAGVDATKRSFWWQFGTIAVSALALAATISLAVATGGAAPIAAAAITGVVFAIHVLDAHYANQNRENALAHARGEPPPHELPMGGSSLGNFIYKLARKCNRSHQTARAIAFWADKFIRLGMAAAVTACTLGSSAAAQSFERVGPLVGSCLACAQALVGLRWDRHEAGQFADGVAGLKEAFDDLVRTVKSDDSLPDEQRAALLADIAGLRQECLDQLSAIANMVPDKRLATGSKLPLAAVTLSGALAVAFPGTDFSDFRLHFGTPGVTLSTATGRGGIDTQFLKA